MKGALVRHESCFGRCQVDRCAVLSLERPAAYARDIFRHLQIPIPEGAVAIADHVTRRYYYYYIIIVPRH